MLGRIADSIAVLFLKKNIINEDELPVYQYGMQVLICNIAGMLTVLIVGILISQKAAGIGIERCIATNVATVNGRNRSFQIP